MRRDAKAVYRRPASKSWHEILVLLTATSTFVCALVNLSHQSSYASQPSHRTSVCQLESGYDFRSLPRVRRGPLVQMPGMYSSRSESTATGLTGPLKSNETENPVLYSETFQILSVDLPEISPYYRHDRRDKLGAPINDTASKDLSRLLEQPKPSRSRDNYDVRVYDHPPIWTRLKEPPRAHLRRQARKWLWKAETLYGPRGHPLVQVGNLMDTDSFVCPLTISQIHSSLMQRELGRMQGQFDQVNAIRLELLVYGVRVHDDFRQWTTDPNHVFLANTASKHSPAFPHAYQCDPSSQSSTSLTIDGSEADRLTQRIEFLVRTRAAALFRGDDKKALFIACKLYMTYGVGVNDTTRTWSIGSRFLKSYENEWKAPTISKISEMKEKVSFTHELFQMRRHFESPNFRRSQNSHFFPNAIVEKRVASMVQERIHNREEGMFLEADAIRRELWSTYNVGVNDRLQQYSLGGVFEI
ncbi:predicted protein [Phaeodactylum tricornutum CCAP 1055/1]|uniref:Uncharacterized protein n=2 Tax=Phaeodactylum tricornutum TaxID=2850 RepID=B7GAB5_PHATC|nr:predicted protein [Phaeodactylum tricornutum CCAP 1055/1]EEC44223.1 predicted protein [Phaeodactylum tricornutum CCAP 1055/1]|eukprot:XP_002184045.1 predicted protein [Phaeodactylum tricornutum CCAP 1055/1]